MLEYDRTDVSEGIHVNKTNASKKCNICHYWYFLKKVSSINHIFTIAVIIWSKKAINLNDVATVSVKGNDYRNHFWYMGKDDAINMIKSSI